MAQTIYQQPSPEEVHAQHSRMVGMPDERFPQAAVMLEEAGPEILAFTAFPVAHWTQVCRTTLRSASRRRYGGAPTSWASS